MKYGDSEKSEMVCQVANHKGNGHNLLIFVVVYATAHLRPSRYPFSFACTSVPLFKAMHTPKWNEEENIPLN